MRLCVGIVCVRFRTVESVDVIKIINNYKHTAVVNGRFAGNSLLLSDPSCTMNQRRYHLSLVHLGKLLALQLAHCGKCPTLFLPPSHSPISFIIRLIKTNWCLLSIYYQTRYVPRYCAFLLSDISYNKIHITFASFKPGSTS